MKTTLHLGRRLAVIVAGLSLGLACSAHAQSSASAYPNAPITFVVPFGPGGTSDQLTRLVGSLVTKTTGQPVIVENKAGADGVIGTQYMLRRPADGYTFVTGTTTTHAANVSLYNTLAYDPLKDFEPVAGLAEGGVLLVVRPDFPANNVQELVALARANPGKYTFGAANSANRAGGELFQIHTDTRLLHVPYKSTTATLTDLVGGQVDMMFADLLPAMPLVKAGKLRVLGISTKTRLASMGDVQTIAEQGFPDYSLTAWAAVFARKGTPEDAVHKLNAIIQQAMQTHEAKELLLPTGWTPMKVTPEQLASIQSDDVEFWAELVEKAGIEKK